jgi:hypothetical protein
LGGRKELGCWRFCLLGEFQARCSPGIDRHGTREDQQENQLHQGFPSTFCLEPHQLLQLPLISQAAFPVACLLERKTEMEHEKKIHQNNYRLQQINWNCVNSMRQVA